MLQGPRRRGGIGARGNRCESTDALMFALLQHYPDGDGCDVVMIDASRERIAIGDPTPTIT
jgi:hypothetical protein